MLWQNSLRIYRTAITNAMKINTDADKDKLTNKAKGIKSSSLQKLSFNDYYQYLFEYSLRNMKYSQLKQRKQP